MQNKVTTAITHVRVTNGHDQVGAGRGRTTRWRGKRDVGGERREHCHAHLAPARHRCRRWAAAVAAEGASSRATASASATADASTGGLATELG